MLVDRLTQTLAALPADAVVQSAATEQPVTSDQIVEAPVDADSITSADQQPAESVATTASTGQETTTDSAAPAKDAADTRDTVLNDGVLTMALIQSGQINPMIGMGKLSPKSFMTSE